MPARAAGVIYPTGRPRLLHVTHVLTSSYRAVFNRGPRMMRNGNKTNSIVLTVHTSGGLNGRNCAIGIASHVLLATPRDVKMC